MSSKYLDPDKDIPILIDGFKSGYAPNERKIAEAVLTRIGYQKIMKGPAWKQKPGRKTPTNPTEDEIHVRIEFLRLVLGDAAKKLSELHLLSALAKLLENYGTQCSKGIYLTQIEIGRIQFLERNIGDLVTQMSDLLRPAEMPCLRERYLPTVADLKNLLADLAESAEASTQTTWDGMFKEAIEKSASKTKNDRTYTAIRVQLGLAIEGPSAAEIETQIANLEKRRSKNPSAIAERNSKIQSLKTEKRIRELHQERSKNETLRMAISTLFCIRNVFDTCRFVHVDSGTELLYEFLHRRAHGMDPMDIPPALGELEALFLGAISRQGHSPFVPLFNEEMDPGPAWIPEDGQLKAKPTGEERVAPVEAVVRVVKAAGTAGIVKADIVKELVKNSTWSPATAYKAISTAEKQKEVKKLTKTKRYVVVGEKVVGTPFVFSPPQMNPAMVDLYKILLAGLKGRLRKTFLASRAALKNKNAPDNKRRSDLLSNKTKQSPT
ncbi:MAG: hypothetical protein WCG52_10755 [bacterium]